MAKNKTKKDDLLDLEVPDVEVTNEYEGSVPNEESKEEAVTKPAEPVRDVLDVYKKEPKVITIIGGK